MALPTLEELTDALRSADEAAEFLSESEDGGTCNFDTAVFFPGRLPRARIEAAAAAAGVRVSFTTWWGKRCVQLLIGSGQGNRRSRMARAAAEALKTAGLDAMLYQQMD